MDYEKAYTNAVARAKQAIKDCGHNEGQKRMIEDIFPELADPDRIRQELIQYLKDYPNLPNGRYCRDDFFAWLEKQGEQPNKVSLWKHWKNGIAGNGEGKLIYLVKISNTYNLCSCLSFECDYIELSELDNMWNWKTNRAVKTISNKQKAFEIANKDRSIELLTQWNKPSYYDGLLQGAMEAMEWKDEQYEQDKQQWIEKATNFLKENVVTLKGKEDKLINNFKKAMEE